ncbi:MAG: hypothetical protein COA79_02660 [Planctomycetota bacterium]|nr:MAG: hypothetical protein COA79_02660 [Planctomycetota bacterium]
MEKWVSKIEATSMFKVTERTLDNWVKSGKINKTRKNGQICYEVSKIMGERNVFEHKEASSSPADIARPVEVEVEKESGPSKNELVLEARLDEKRTQINILSEKLEAKYKDLNTLALNNGSVSEKAQLFQNEIESLRNEKESLRNEKEAVLKQKDVLSEKSFSRFGTYLFVLMMILFIAMAIGVYVWKNKETEKIFLVNSTQLKANLTKLDQTIEKISLDKDKLRLEIDKIVKNQEISLQKKTSELLIKLDELYKQLINKEKLISEEKEKTFLSNQKISEEKKHASELRKQLERLQKHQKELILENSALKIKIGISEALKNQQVNSEKKANPRKNNENHAMENSTE